MNYLKILFYTIMILKISTANAQELSSHQWKDRLVLILIDDTNNQTYQNQILAFQENMEGLNERKLIVYHIKPTQYKLGLTTSNWQESKKLFNQFKKTDASFEILLIGLDGSTKLRRTEFISCEELFRTIDVMPMRRKEINKKENED